MNIFKSVRTIALAFIFCWQMVIGGRDGIAQQRELSTASTEVMTADGVFEIIKKVGNWQLDSIERHGLRHSEREWTSATLFTGFMALADLSGGNRYEQYMREHIAEKFNWQLYHDKYRYYADNYCVGQLYTWFYRRSGQNHQIADLKHMADTLVSRPHTESLAWKNEIYLREWAWCDALFMGPPVLASLYDVTADIAYLDLVDELWWKTTDYLYDTEKHFYLRDGSYFDKREANGEPVFWSRGNGWVLGGLVRVLDYMPKSYENRPKWEQLYHELAEAVVATQQPDGYWRTSLLHPEAYPALETSGTALYVYALAWGINNGLLDLERYGDTVRRGWLALINSVHPSGKLGYVQQVGEAPGNVIFEDTEIYGVGVFLLAGSEMHKLLTTSTL